MALDGIAIQWDNEPPDRMAMKPSQNQERPNLERPLITVRFLGFFRLLVGSREVSVEVSEEATVLDVLKLLCETYGPKFGETLFRSPGQVPTHVRVFLNEEEASMSDRAAGSDGSAGKIDLFVLPITAGGCW